MIWFLMAALVLPGTDIISFKINKFSQFNTEYECVNYINTYDKYLKAGLNRAYPGSKVVDIRCVDIETINSMHKHRNKGKEASR